MTALFIVLIIIVVIIQLLSFESAIKNVSYDCEFSKLLVEANEEFEITITISNRGRAFIPFVKIEQAFPAALKVKGIKINKTAMLNDYIYHVSTLYLMPRSKYVKRVKASFSERGRYIFPGAYIKVGDFLALGDKIKKHELIWQEIVVYPGETTLADVSAAMSGIMGDISVRRFIMEDPILISGFREYTGREPLKAISWNHSAKAGELVVKQYDYTIESVVSVILDVEGNGSAGDAQKKEFTFSAARSLCQILENRGMKYDFLTNATTGDSFARWSYKPEGSGIRHFSIILEGLGRATYTHVESLKTLTENFVKNKNYDRFCILITVKDPSSIDTAYIEKNNGGKVYVISA